MPLILPIALLLVVLVVRPAFAMTGNEWREWSEGARATYVVGVMEGWYYASGGVHFFREGCSESESIRNGVIDRNMTIEQTLAVSRLI